MRIGRAGSGFNGRLIRKAVAAKGNVLRDGAAEEHRLLAHQPHVGAQPLEVEVARISAVQQDLDTCQLSTVAPGVRRRAGLGPYGVGLSVMPAGRDLLAVPALIYIKSTLQGRTAAPSNAGGGPR